uniref:Ionotropic glutamate receptor L-glutamate and glycine-binding domain-containing protein n=1 Tax=Timema douglasi TaxID=61478 RepID=A0A7R8VMW8_TIMDO|nr:unnamed protein product [Timema douglasi]
MAVCNGSGVSTQTFQGVIPAVYHNYHRSCVILLFSSQDGILGYDVKSVVMTTTLTLQEKDVQVTSIPVQQFGKLQEIGVCPRKPPLLVVLSADNATRTFLKEMSTTGKLHRPSWFLLLPDVTPLEEFFADIYVPFNCKFLVARSFRDHVTLTEVYRVDQDSSLIISPFGHWSAATGLTWCRCSLYNRRKQLNGHNIRAAVVHEPPFTDVREKDDGILYVGGYFGLVWGLLETRINFTTTWRKPSDGSWGMFENDSWSVVGKDSLNKTQRHGSWNGMIGMIQRQEVEVAINEFSMTSLRLNVVDFTIPLLATK